MAVFRDSSGKPAKLGNGEASDKSPVSRKRLVSPHLLTSLIPQRSELPVQSTAVKRPLHLPGKELYGVRGLWPPILSSV